MRVIAIFTLFFSLCSNVCADDPPFKLPPMSELKKIRSAVIETEAGNLVVQLFPEEAPWHVANFKYLADQGFYKNLTFHIAKDGYVLQTGAPGKRANSGPGYTLPPEFNSHKHEYGSLTMVRKPNDLDVDFSRRSHGSQFRILLQAAPHMDGQFTVFGKVIKGSEFLPRLQKGSTVKDIKVFVQREE